MSQPYAYSGYYQQQYYPNSYDSTHSMHTPIQQPQSHASAYDYQNQYYDNTGVTPSAQAVNDSSTLSQTYSYSDENYTPDSAADTLAYNSPHQMAPQYPDSVNQIPHQGVPQYGDAPGQSWTGPNQYAKDTTVQPGDNYDQPGDVYDQRRGSCTSVNTDTSEWYSHDGTDHYDYNQAAPEEPQYPDYYYQQPQQYQQDEHQYQDQEQQQQQPEAMTFGMYSPTQYARTQELARNAPCDNQWAPVTAPNEVPYGMLAIHEPRVERRASDAYQGYDNGSVDQHPAHSSPPAQSYYPPSGPPPVSESVPEDDNQEDLFIQQRLAASYQQGLQVRQELKYQMSGQFEQFEETQRPQSNFAADQNHSCASDTSSHQHHHRQNSSSSNQSRRLVAPIVPSQARERAAPYPQTSSEKGKGKEKEKEEAPPKKPALACLFCRKRKIACGPPPPDSLDRTCNQCARRRQTCEYPTESRRGIRKTPKEPAPEEPTVHKFVHGDASAHEGVGPVRTRVRRKRTSTSTSDPTSDCMSD